MKPWFALFLVCVAVNFAFGQNSEVLHTVFNEENSGLTSPVCYNWNQLPNGALYISSNAGLSRFDGKNFYHYTTKGRGKAMASSTYDATGKLWCNSFHGDVFYLQKDSLIRHAISDSIRELTVLQRVDDQLYLYTENKLYRINGENQEISLLRAFQLIRTIFKYKGEHYVLSTAAEGNTLLHNLNTGEDLKVHWDFATKSRCRYIQGEEQDFLFFEDAAELVPLDQDLIADKLVSKVFPKNEKIYFSTYINDELVICGVKGIRFFNLKGEETQHFLAHQQISQVGIDTEGNFLYTSIGSGFGLIPSLKSSVVDLSTYLNDEYVIRSISDGNSNLYLGTSAGKVLHVNLADLTVETLDLGLRSEVVSLCLSQNREELYVYCDALYRVRLSDFTVVERIRESSIKTMVNVNQGLLQGSRKGLMLLTPDGKVENYAEIGWVISMLPIVGSDKVLVSSKKGFFKFDVESKLLEKITLKGIDEQLTISHLKQVGNYIYFLSNYQDIYRCNLQLEKLERVYHHENNLLNGYVYVDGKLFVFGKGEVLVNYTDGSLVIPLRSKTYLNEKSTTGFYALDKQFIAVHKYSLTLLKELPTKVQVKPDFNLHLSQNSSFKKEGKQWTSDFQNNVLQFKLTLFHVLRDEGSVKAYYQLGNETKDWKVIENPYEEIKLERLPMGKGSLRIQLESVEGLKSEVKSFTYLVRPPFYLSHWFLVLSFVLIVVSTLLLIKWRESKLHQKAKEKLEKQALETRTLNAELTAIRSQMNPHFIFNVLTAIQAKVIQGQIDEAYSNIGDFAILIRNVLEKSGKEFISLEDEIALMKNYVELENSRLSTPVIFKVALDDEVYFEDVLIPTLITQPLLENCIRHAFPSSQLNPQIELLAKRKPNGFELIIRDNGQGIHNQTQNKEHSSFALTALQKRISSLSLKAPYTINLAIESSQNGTSVRFSFKYK